MVKQIVILHGWQQKLDRWQEFINGLSQKYRVYLPYMPGFGNNKLFKPFTLNDYLLWLQDYLKKHKIDNPIIIGYSFGGRVALRFASFRNKIYKLILIDSAGIKPKNTWHLRFWKMIAGLGKLIFNLPLLNLLKKPATWFLYQIIQEKDYYQASPLLKKTMTRILTEDLRSDLKNINVPTLILWGKQDKSTPIQDAYYMKNNIAQAKLKIFSQANHALPFILTKSVIQEICNFIDNDTT